MISEVDHKVRKSLPLHLLESGSRMQAVLQSKDLLLQVFLQPLAQVRGVAGHLLSFFLQELACSLQNIAEYFPIKCIMLSIFLCLPEHWWE